MDLRKVKTLIDLVSESSITELEITEGDGKVRIVKAGPTTHYSVAPPTAYFPMPDVAAGAPGQQAPVAITPEFAGNVVKSPMVGTFYASGAPGKPPFVEIGAKVSSTDTVCIIEAMKLLNEIEAGFDGEIKKILVQNGQAVEYGQPLFVIA